MTCDPLSPPLLTADLPGIGGRIKQHPEDFEVEEIPAYEPCGTGNYLYLWMEKRGMGAQFFARQIARRLGIAPADVGMAGLKDRHAVTRQWVSVPEAALERLGQLKSEGLCLLHFSRHGNKLRSGHLRGNRFSVLIRDVEPQAVASLTPVLDRLDRHGLPNYYGPQRFGIAGETLDLGWAVLRGERSPKPLPRFLRKLALSAVQSGLFNQYLAQRLKDGLLRQVLAGDVMSKLPAGGLFVAQDVVREQSRFESRETMHTGPIFGRKTFPANDTAAARETAVLRQNDIDAKIFFGFGKMLRGTRRHDLIYLDDLSAVQEPAGIRLKFTLPAGAYATVLLREISKKTSPGDDDEEATV